MDDISADDAQSLQGLFELLLNLGNLDSNSADDFQLNSPDRISNDLLNSSDSDRILDIKSEECAEESQEKQSDETYFSDPFDYVDPVEYLAGSELVTVIPNSQNLDTSQNNNAQNTEGAIASLQGLLFGSDLQILRTSVHTLDRKVQDLEHHIYEPQELIQLLVPVISDILGIKVSKASAEITKAIAPVIDEMIAVNIKQDQVQMSAALAPVMSSAIAQNIVNAPGEFANVIAPEMGTAIQEQLRINKGAMIDALYPIIGNTIAKYFAEALKTINEKVEHTLSKEGILRKVRARLQGVSEAELILKESIPLIIRAIFLVHKSSGLIISEAQNPDSDEILESDMMAGMLTAIRSFVNDCITRSGFDTELSEIDYGGSKIILEAAGHCYMAVVVDGTTSSVLINKIRRTLEAIVETHSKDIENFNGDLAAVPTPIKPSLVSLFTKTNVESKARNPYTLGVLVLLIVAAIAIPWSLIGYRQQSEAQLKIQIDRALFAAPELSVYGLSVNINRVDWQQQIELKGRVPSSYLRDLATKIAIASAPLDTAISNQILAVNILPDPLLIAAEVKRVNSLLNRLNGIKISATFNLNNKNLNEVLITGKIQNPIDAKTVTAAFAQIPGVAIVTNTIQLQPPEILIKVYFDYNSTDITKIEMPKILQMKLIMDRYPSYYLKIVGHSDRLGDAEANRQIALKRAQIVRDLLTKSGLSTRRSRAVGSPESENSPELSRYVGFELDSINLTK